MVQTIADMKVYWRGALYVLCKIDFILRISMSNAKYRLVPMPSDTEFKRYGCLSLGRSEKGYIVHLSMIGEDFEFFT